MTPNQVNLKPTNQYLEALRLSCLKNIELANKELEEKRSISDVKSKTSARWFDFISKKKPTSPNSKELEAYKSNVCRQMMISKKISSLAV